MTNTNFNHAHRLESLYPGCRFDKIQNQLLLRDIQASATMIKYDTLYTGYDPRTLIYRTVYQWEKTSSM
jgi:hypothetical protein